MAKIKKRASGSVLLSRKPNTGSSLSRKAGRTLIRTHHTLHKQLAQALARNDHAAAELLRQQIDANGGLEKYQKASVPLPVPRPRTLVADAPRVPDQRPVFAARR